MGTKKKSKPAVAAPGKDAVKKTAAKKTAQKISPAGQVEAWMNNPALVMPAETAAVRKIIKSAHKDIGERIKWNAPSYYYRNEDMVTFNAWAKDNVHLVFHHPCIEQVQSPLLQGKHKGRRMVYFENMKAVNSSGKELIRVIQAIIQFINKK